MGYLKDRDEVLWTPSRITNNHCVGVYESTKPFQDLFCENSQGWIVPNIDKIKGFNDLFDFVLVNCSTEHWGSERDFPLIVRIHDTLEQYLSRKFLCVSHDPSDENLRSGIRYFPFFGWRRPLLPVDTAVITRCSRRYLFSNLNRVARDFRIANYLMMRSKPYFDRCLVTFYRHFQNHNDYDGHFALDAGEQQAWHEISPQLDQDVTDQFGVIYDMHHPAFFDSYVHLVSETTIKDKIFITEKTWQTVMAGQLFVVWGNSGIVSHLRDLGVDVFDDIIDHAYDAISDARQRLHGIHAELDRLSKMDWSEIYKNTLDRRMLNSRRFTQGEFVADHVARLRMLLPPGSADL